MSIFFISFPHFFQAVPACNMQPPSHNPPVSIRFSFFRKGINAPFHAHKPFLIIAAEAPPALLSPLRAAPPEEISPSRSRIHARRMTLSPIGGDNFRLVMPPIFASSCLPSSSACSCSFFAYSYESCCPQVSVPRPPFSADCPAQQSADPIPDASADAACPATPFLLRPFSDEDCHKNLIRQALPLKP